MSRRTLRRTPGILAPALLLLLATAGCGNPAQGQGKGGAPGKGPRLYPVRIAKVGAQPLNYYIETTGTVRAKDVYRIDAQVAGVLQNVAFNEGDEVTPETVLARISTEAYDVAVQKAEASLLKAGADLKDAERRLANDIKAGEVNLEAARIEFERRQKVQDAGAISVEEVQLYKARYDLARIRLDDMREQVETEIAVLRAQHKEREADLKIARENQRKSVVRAPIPGVIEQRMVTDGVHVSAGAPLALLVDRKEWRLEFMLAEREASHVREGSELTFNVPAYPGRELKATVYRVGDMADARSRLVTGWARVEPTDALLKAGYFATLKIVSAAKKEAVVVPQTAVLPTEYGFVVYVVEEGKAKRLPIKLGLHVTDAAVEVLEGLKVGENVVVEGANALLDGVGVQVLSDEPKPEAKTGEAKGKEREPGS